ncbi:MAG: YdcH family protein [bacterium]|nr:YdcH family protein [bacterium]MDT8365909.1 YdcH family protein [bacterium]
MSKARQDLIKRILEEDEEYRDLHEKHLAFEEQIQELQKRPPSTEIHFEIEGLKKQKLQGKDKMERILTKYS